MRLEKPTHSPEIGIHTWDFGAGAFNSLFATAVDEVLKDALQSPDFHGIEASLPNAWADSDGNGGPPTPDPLTIYIFLPLASYEQPDDEPFWSLSLDALITDELSSWSEDDGSMEENTKAFALRLRDRLRELADKIDEQVASSL